MEDEVRIEQVRLIYQSIPVFIIGNLIATPVIAYFFWDVSSREMIIAWSVLMYVVHLLGYYSLYRAYSRSDFTTALANMHARRFTAAELVSGAAWGSAGIVLFPNDSLVYQLFLCAIIFISPITSVAAVVVYRKLFYIMLALTIFPAAFRMAMEDNDFRYLLVSIAPFYIMLLAYYNRTINESLLSSLQLRFQNINLSNQLRGEKLRAEEASHAKSRFLAAASHDLRQPLHALGLFVGELKFRLDDSRQEILINKIESSLISLTELLNALLDISKLDAGSISAKVADVDLNKLINEICDEITPQALEKGLKIKKCFTNRIVHSDPSLLRRVLLNLIANAIRYTRKGGILIGCRSRGNYILLEIYDTGIGIPINEMEHVFEEFYQIDNPERDRNKGIGLGLSIVKRILKILGHEFYFTSTVNQGTKFTIKLPLGNTANVNVMDESSAQYEYASLEGRRVLCVDDELMVLEAISGLLQSWGCEVLTASSTESALTKLSKFNFTPELIISDYRLPNGETGIQAIHKLYEVLQEKIPAVLVTGDTDLKQLREVKDSGIELIHKPIHPADLHAVLFYMINDT